MTKHPPLSYLRPVEVDAIERLRGARKLVPTSLPSMKELLTTHGHAWLCEPQNANVRFVSPFPCMKCGGHVQRVGDGSCVACFLDIPDIVIAERVKKTKSKDKADAGVQDSDTAAP